MKRLSILSHTSFLLTLLTVIAVPLHAQEGKIDITLPDFSKVAAETVDVTLDGQMLRLAAKFLADDPNDKEAAQVVSGLSGIYVKSVSFDAKGQYSKADVDRVRSQLGAGWSRIVVSTSRDGENAEIWVRAKNDHIAGMVIIAAEPDELTIVNLVGEIDLERLARIEGQFGIPEVSGDSKKAAPKGDKP